MESTGGEGQKCEGLSFDSNVPPDPEAANAGSMASSATWSPRAQRVRALLARPTDCYVRVRDKGQRLGKNVRCRVGWVYTCDFSHE